MDYKLWQVQRGRTRDFGFMSLEERAEVLQTEEISLSVYEVTYKGTVADDERINRSLEYLFGKFNVNRPDDFKGYSMSVGDMVEINGKFYYTDSFGFKDVTGKVVR